MRSPSTGLATSIRQSGRRRSSASIISSATKRRGVALERPRSDVPDQVEGRVVDPGRRGKPQRRRRDQEHLDRVTAHVARLETEDAGVLAAQPLQLSGLRSLAQLVTDSASGRAAPQGLARLDRATRLESHQRRCLIASSFGWPAGHSQAAARAGVCSARRRQAERSVCPVSLPPGHVKTGRGAWAASIGSSIRASGSRYCGLGGST